MAELKIDQLERNLAENGSYKEEERSTDDIVNNLGEEVRYFDSIGSRWGDWQSWGRKGCHYWRNSRQVIIEDKLPALRDMPKKKLLDETPKFCVNLRHTALQRLQQDSNPQPMSCCCYK